MLVDIQALRYTTPRRVINLPLDMALLLPGFEPRFLYRPRRSWEDDIKMDLRETGRQDVENFIWLSTGTGEGIFCVCGNETSGSIKCGEFLD